MSYDIKRRTKSVVIVDHVDMVAPLGGSQVITVDDIETGNYSEGVLMISVGQEAATATLDVKFEVKDSAGHLYTHTDATQVTAAGNSVKTMDPIYGRLAKVTVTLGNAENDAFDDVYVELVLKS